MAKIFPHFLGLFVEVICTSFLPLFGRSLCSSSSFHSSFPFSLPLAAEVETPYLTVSSPFFRPPSPLLPSSALPLSPLPFFVCVGRAVLLCVGRKERVGGGQSSSSCSNFFLFSPCLAAGVKRELKGRSHALFSP